jgi:hypothetical protein
MPKQMHLALDVSWTQVETAWRMPGSRVGHHYPDIGLFEDIARIAERGLFDMIFFGDGSGVPNTWEGGIDAAVRGGVAWPRLDMSPWIAAMSRVTSHVGFGLTSPIPTRACERVCDFPADYVGSHRRLCRPCGIR